MIAERAHHRGIEPEEEKQRIIDHDIPIGTWDRVHETLHPWQQVGFQRIYLLRWIGPWDRQRAEATFKALAGYS